MMLRNDNELRTPGEVWRDRLLTTAAAVVLGLTLSNVAPADEVSKETKKLANAEYKAAMDKAQTPIAYQDADEFKAWWDRDAAMLADVIKKIGRVETK